MEQWKDIKGFESLYQISNLGRVKSLSRKWKPDESILVNQINTFGYHVVRLGQGVGKYKQFFIHRLVALHFIDNPNNLSEVNHKDGDKLNNDFTNLEWVSRSKNMIHAFDTRLVSNSGTDNPNCKLTETIVLCILKEYESGISKENIMKKYNLTLSNYKNIIHRRTWKQINPENLII